ncbi:apolipoprotein A-I-like [Dunckerocampus dactyliophorus]|uniref:apolipoprotein A-I-like n=1 Tax=Dunckerocampus dactyliophorus TaxID=161453 RepID=UPI0024053D62|nr:apolipoprotein A-I-like [Dunckerocampus dactyliophorus]
MPPAEGDVWGVRSTSTETHGSHAFPLLHARTHPLSERYIRSAAARAAQSPHELDQTSIMKFAVLALTLLLAVGSQAASLQADAPSQLEHARSMANLFLTELKESTKKALNQLDDTEYKEIKVQMNQRLDDFHTQLQALQQSVAPMTDSVVATVMAATESFRTSIEKDIEELKKTLAPQQAKLKEVVDKHIEEYRILLEPALSDYQTRQTANMEALRTKLEPIVAELQTKVAVNVEETKAALVPMIEAVRAKVNVHLEELKAAAKPYVDEYKEQIMSAYGQAKSISAEDLAALKSKIAPMVEDVKAKLQSIFEAVYATVSHSA